MEELVSIITPLFNSERFLSDCVESVLQQTYRNWEMIIVDDCSSDSSYALANQFAEKEPRIRVFQLNTNSGSGVARNKAIKEARGSIIAFLDSDDVWHSQKLSRHLKAMLQAKAAFSHTSYGYMSENGKKLTKKLEVSNDWVDYKGLLKRTEISCLTAMYDVRVVGKVYMPVLRRKQDYALWLEILKRGHMSFPVNECLAWYRQVEGSATSKKSSLIIKHYFFLRQTQSLSRFASLYYTIYWLVNGIIRYYIK